MAHRHPSEPPVVHGYGSEPIEHRPVRLLPFALWIAAFAFLMAVATCGEVEDPTGPPERAVEVSR